MTGSFLLETLGGPFLWRMRMPWKREVKLLDTRCYVQVLQSADVYILR